jgi:formylglycine-generating enzyme required for sulfatase activity/serine/threonine protein kinase
MPGETKTPEAVCVSTDNHALIGKTIGGYEILSELASGGMGTVFRARHTRLEKVVAIKVLSPKMQQVDEYVERFHREALLAAKLEHPNIVRIYDYGQHDNIFYFVMQFVEGQCLSDLLRAGLLPLGESLRITREIAAGLERAHESGLVHRDIKPDNILISERREVLITDFGLVKESTSSVDAGLTAGGAILGTPYYMSPEQCEGLPDIDHRSDLYSLGLILYEMVVGAVPAVGETAMLIMHNRLLTDPPPPIASKPDLSPALNDLVMHLLAKDPNDRLDCATDLIAQIDAIQQNTLHESSRFMAISKAELAPNPPAPASEEIPTADSTRQIAVKDIVTVAAPPDAVLGPLPGGVSDADSSEDTAIRNPPSSAQLQALSEGGPSLETQVVQTASIYDPTSSNAHLIPVIVGPDGSLTANSGTLPAYIPVGLPLNEAPPEAERSLLPLILAGVVFFLICMLFAVVLAFNSRRKPVSIVSLSGAKAWTNLPSLEITGQANQGPVIVTIGSESMSSDDEGRFKRTVPLLEGKNDISLEVKGPGGTVDNRSIPVQLDSIPPSLTLIGEEKGVLVLGKDRILKGQIQDKNPVGVSINQAGSDGGTERARKIEFDQNGHFQHQLSDSSNSQQLVIEARDRGGNVTRKEVNVITRGKLSIETLSKIPSWTNQKLFVIDGKASFGPVSVTLGGNSLRSTNTGAFRGNVKLNEGPNEVTIVVKGENGVTDTRRFTIQCDTTGPSLIVDGEKSDGQLQLGPAALLRGSLTERNLSSLTVDGKKIELNAEQRFEVKVSNIVIPREIIVVARDKAGNESRRKLSVSLQTKLQVTVTTNMPKYTRRNYIEIVGAVNREKRCSITIAGVKSRTKRGGRFVQAVELSEGFNSIEIVVIDEGQQKAQQALTTIRDTARPNLVINDETSAAEIFLTSGGLLKGQVKDQNMDTLTLDGQTIELSDDGRFQVAQQFSGPPKKIHFMARDKAGNETKHSVTIYAAGSFAIDIKTKMTSWMPEKKVKVEGKVTKGPATLMVNKTRMRTRDDGSFGFRISLREGENTLNLKAIGPANMKAERVLVFRYDSIAPRIILDGEERLGQIAQSSLTLTGKIIEKYLKSAFIGSHVIEPDIDGRFTIKISEQEKRKPLVALLEDKAGNKTSRTIVVDSAESFKEQAVSAILFDHRAWANASGDLQDQAIAKATALLSANYQFKEIQAYSAGGRSYRIANYVHKATGIEMLLIPGGKYQMGSQLSDPSEQPVHQVTIDPFLMGRFETKQKEWMSVEKTPNKSRHKGAALPVEMVSWNAIQTWLAGVKSKDLRLPSEAEWEYACRAGTTTKFFWGDQWQTNHTWFRGNSNKNYSKKRKTFPGSAHETQTNAFGLIDITGNVKEWCQDDYIGDYKNGPNGNQARKSEGAAEYRCVRGGSFKTGFTYTRSYARFKHAPKFLATDLGFRVAAALPWQGPKPVVADKVEINSNANQNPAGLLTDMKRYARSTPKEQDKAIELVAVKLGKAYKFLKTRSYICGPLQYRIASFKHLETGMAFQLIPGGAYLMGSQSGADNEKPAHTVKISKPFLMGKFEALQREWDVYDGEDNRHWKGNALPLESVSWDAIQQWLAKSKGGFRLPSEAEWEYACRAGSTARHFWGETWDGSYTWFKSNAAQNYSKVARPHIGVEHEAKSNAFGLVDMLGNVKEWCKDDFLGNYRQGPKDEQALGRGKSEYRIVRGGSWFTDKFSCRSSLRLKYNPSYDFKDLGFRVAVSIPQ